MKKILIFPGTFNPPHLGHASALEIALREVVFDEVWIIPSGRRDDKTISISYEHRKSLGNLFVDFLQSQHTVRMKLNTEELDDRDRRNTQEILKQIRSQPDVLMMQLIGLDGWLSLHKQLSADEFRNERFVVVTRPGFERSSDFRSDSNSIFLDGTTQAISSTQIRMMIKDGNENYKQFVPDKIATYIDQYKLYR